MLEVYSPQGTRVGRNFGLPCRVTRDLCDRHGDRETKVTGKTEQTDHWRSPSKESERGVRFLPPLRGNLPRGLEVLRGEGTLNGSYLVYV